MHRDLGERFLDVLREEFGDEERISFNEVVPSVGLLMIGLFLKADFKRGDTERLIAFDALCARMRERLEKEVAKGDRRPN